MSNLTTRLRREDGGFTLIELLVVILIIGILAAIAIPSFLNQRDKSQDTCAKTQVRTMATSMEAYYTEANSYETTLDGLHQIENAVVTDGACGDGSLATVGTAGDGVGGCLNPGAGLQTGYCVSQTSPSGATFAISRDAVSGTTRTCGPGGVGDSNRQGKGGCLADGSW